MPPSRRERPIPAPSTSLDAHEVVEVEADVFRKSCLQLLDRVRNRDFEIVVTKRGEAVARVAPPHAQLPSAFGFLRGTVLAQGDIVSPDPEPWGDHG